MSMKVLFIDKIEHLQGQNVYEMAFHRQNGGVSKAKMSMKWLFIDKMEYPEVQNVHEKPSIT
jgi:hypothetical protein